MKEDFDVKEELKKMPELPGVYLMHAKNDEIIYVGKAINLKRRVSSYFRKMNNRSAKIEPPRNRSPDHGWDANELQEV